MAIHISNFTEQQTIAELQRIQLRAGSLFRAVGMDDIADNPPTPKLVFERAISENLLWLATYCKHTVGFALALNHGCDCHLEQMSVDPEHTRRGIGAALLEHLITSAREERYERITLSTFQSLPWNAPFYAKMGFNMVPDSELTTDLREVIRKETVAGLDMAIRVIMAYNIRS